MKMQNLLCFCLLFAVGIYAESEDDQPEPMMVRYFVQVGGAGVLPTGSMDGKTIANVDASGDTTIVPEKVAVPKLPPFVMATIRLGAYLNASTITAGFGYGRPMLTQSPASQPIPDQHANLINFDFEYQYHFNFPGVWRPAIGISYGFTRMDVTGASLAQVSGQTKTGDVLFSGAGPSLLTGLGWYGHEHWAVVSELRFGLWPVANITTSFNSLGQLANSLYEFEPSLNVSVQTFF